MKERARDQQHINVCQVDLLFLSLSVWASHRFTLWRNLSCSSIILSFLVGLPLCCNNVYSLFLLCRRINCRLRRTWTSDSSLATCAHLFVYMARCPLSMLRSSLIHFFEQWILCVLHIQQNVCIIVVQCWVCFAFLTRLCPLLCFGFVFYFPIDDCLATWLHALKLNYLCIYSLIVSIWFFRWFSSRCRSVHHTH